MDYGPSTMDHSNISIEMYQLYLGMTGKAPIFTTAKHTQNNYLITSHEKFYQ